MDVVERDDFAEGSREPSDRRQHRTDFLASLDPAIGSRLVGFDGVGHGQRQGLQVLASQHPVRAVSHDASKPAGERSRVDEARQRVPGRHERFLDDVFRLPEVADEIASGRGPNRRLQIHLPPPRQ